MNKKISPHKARAMQAIGIATSFLIPMFFPVAAVTQIAPKNHIALTSGYPVKLSVWTPQKNLVPGAGTRKITVFIYLLDAQNRKVNSPRDVPVELTITASDGKIIRRSLDVIRANSHSLSVEIPIASDIRGPVNVQAKHKFRNLKDGGMYINVSRWPFKSGLEQSALPRSFRRFRAMLLSRQGGRRQPQRNAAQPPLSVRLSPINVSKIIPDGEDYADILVTLTRSTNEKVYVTLASTGGRLSRRRLVFPPRATGLPFNQECHLTSTQIGTATVSIVGAVTESGIDVPVQGKSTTSVPCKWQVNNLRLRQSPPRINLLEQSTVWAELGYRKDKNTFIPAVPDEERTINLVLSTGVGRTQPIQLKVKPPDFSSSAVYIPNFLGQEVISAGSEWPDIEPINIEVIVPWAQLIMSVLGGLLGGMLAFWQSHEGDSAAFRRRLVLGLVTGFVLYWAVIAGLIGFGGNGVNVAIGNPLTALVLSTLGGYAGATVLDFLLKQLGILSSGSAKT